MQPYRVVQKRVLNEKYGAVALLRTSRHEGRGRRPVERLGLALKSIEVALAAAKATESRARELLALARTSPEFFAKSRGIYERAGARVRRLEPGTRQDDRESFLVTTIDWTRSNEMANIYEPSEEYQRAIETWVAGRPETVRRVAERFKPWKLYRMRSTGHRVTVYSFLEHDDGSPVGISVEVLGDYNLVAFERRVIEVDPTIWRSAIFLARTSSWGVGYESQPTASLVAGEVFSASHEEGSSHLLRRELIRNAQALLARDQFNNLARLRREPERFGFWRKFGWWLGFD